VVIFIATEPADRLRPHTTWKRRVNLLILIMALPTACAEEPRTIPRVDGLEHVLSSTHCDEAISCRVLGSVAPPLDEWSEEEPGTFSEVASMVPQA